MFFALDENNIRVNAEDGEFKHCVCPACRKPVIQKALEGNYRRPHFAHKKKEATCPFEYNSDYKNMSDWHIRMQGYFPKEERECIFTDKETGEKHIADVFIKEANTVLEFQHSSLKKKEFLDRTMFHLNEGRRIAWLFDESWKKPDEESYNRKYNKGGKLERESNWRAEGPYKTKSFKWLYRRKFVEEGPPIYQPNYSVCLFTGAEGDVFHRIIRQEEQSIIVSLHDIAMSNELNVEDFFALETLWQEQEPWKNEIEAMGRRKPFSKYNSPQKRDVIEEEIEEYHISMMDIAEARRLHNEVKRSQYHEDYWKALLEYYDDLESRWKK